MKEISVDYIDEIEKEISKNKNIRIRKEKLKDIYENVWDSININNALEEFKNKVD